METKFDFNSSVCTSIDQSKRLLALGLKKGTADMTIVINEDGSWHIEVKPYTSWQGDMEYYPIGIPAWSLGRLLEVMRMKASSQIVPLDDTFDRLIEGIETRIKEGYFNKEYLV